MIADHVLHLVARVALRARSPRTAKRVVDAVGRLLPALSVEEAAALSRTLEGTGTCLTRALTVAARLPGSQVVIGSDGRSGTLFLAHAWVERDGNVIGGVAPSREVFARLRPRDE